MELKLDRQIKKNVLPPLLFCVFIRVVVYFFAIKGRHFFEGDSVRYMGYMVELLERGTIDDGNWNAPGYFLFEALSYQVLHWGHYGLLAFQNIFDLVLAYLLMSEVRRSAKACWVIALVGTCDLASVMYANAMMTESLSAFFLSFGVWWAFRRQRPFLGSFFCGLSCVVRGGNWPVYVVFLLILLLMSEKTAPPAPVASTDAASGRSGRNSRTPARFKFAALLFFGALFSVGPVITYNGVKFNHWNLSSQGEYHAVTLGAGIIMRQKNVSWAQGEKEFNAYHDNLLSQGVIPPGLSLQRSRMRALVHFISENRSAFLWSVARGFATQLIGGQNAEIMHRFAGREIEKEPLPPLVHRALIGLHALWMCGVWICFIAAVWFLWRRKLERPLILFTMAALVYFFVSVATLGSARFRIPCMASVALCTALGVAKREARGRTPVR